MKIEMVVGDYAHIAPIAANMRTADVQEIWASCRSTPLEALEFSFKRSSHILTRMIDGEPVAMMGMGDVNILGGLGSPWLLGTNKATYGAGSFVRATMGWLAARRRDYRLMMNFVDGRNKVSVRWLKWVGFEFEEVPRVMNGVDFYLFSMRGIEQQEAGVAAEPRTGIKNNV